jgi:hypothetical protein
VCVQELIKTGASAEIVDANKRNALHHACRKDHDDVVRFLLESAKMDINASSESKDTPLHKAGGWVVDCPRLHLAFLTLAWACSGLYVELASARQVRQDRCRAAQVRRRPEPAQ